jgi:hypothetical protein
MFRRSRDLDFLSSIHEENPSYHHHHHRHLTISFSSRHAELPLPSLWLVRMFQTVHTYV